jgi:hypothetical protein
VCLSKHHDVKTYWGVEVLLHASLTSALDEGELSDSCPGRFTPRERIPGTHWIRDWVVPRAGLDAMRKRKILSMHKLFMKRVFRFFFQKINQVWFDVYYYKGDQIKEGGIGGARGEVRNAYILNRETWREEITRKTKV